MTKLTEPIAPFPAYMSSTKLVFDSLQQWTAPSGCSPGRSPRASYTRWDIPAPASAFRLLLAVSVIAFERLSSVVRVALSALSFPPLYLNISAGYLSPRTEDILDAV